MLGMLSLSQSTNVGRAKEKMLISKMIQILTPENEEIGISFENLIIFLATSSNINVPYKEEVKQEIAQVRDLKDDMVKIASSLESLPNEISEDSQVHMKQSQTSLLGILEKSESKYQTLTSKSRYKYGYFNSKGTIIFSESDKRRIQREFLVFASNRQEFLSAQQKLKAEQKKAQILGEFDHVPKINENSAKLQASRSSNYLPIYDNLIQKGQEYQMKNQIKRDLEKNLKNEECTFRPEVSEISKQLAHNDLEVGLIVILAAFEHSEGLILV